MTKFMFHVKRAAHFVLIAPVLLVLFSVTAFCMSVVGMFEVLGKLLSKVAVNIMLSYERGN